MLRGSLDRRRLPKQRETDARPRHTRLFMPVGRRRCARVGTIGRALRDASRHPDESGRCAAALRLAERSGSIAIRFRSGAVIRFAAGRRAVFAKRSAAAEHVAEAARFRP
ncbi:hypothetical protein WS62_31045 [Burkholderia sp. ABCPW 14]|nr:hypothetical protein WS62_31045 [Burkholderia sp. ABCPW 14]